MAIILLIQREPRAYDRFEVPYREGMSVLDALKHVAHSAPDLTFRWECGQGICGVCTMTINGKPALCCTTLLQPDTMYTLEPLAGFPVEKDLLVDFQPRLERLLDVQPYLVEGSAAVETKAQADQSKLLRACIESWACVAVCPISQNTQNADALSMVKLARFALDPRDGADRTQLASARGLDLYAKTCPSCRACMNVCPKQIDVYVDAVQVLVRQAAASG